MSMGELALALDEEFYHEQKLSVEEYLQVEAGNEIRHEFSGGQLRAMAGASIKHEIVAQNVNNSLHNHLRGKGCLVFKADIKVRLQVWDHDSFYYPDVMVVCDPSGNHANYVERPKLIVEVLTDWDRDMVLKYFAYQHIASLEEYVVVSQEPNDQRAWIFRRADNWQPREVRSGTLTFASVDLSLELGSLYAL